jgi:TolB-like protein
MKNHGTEKRIAVLSDLAEKPFYEILEASYAAADSLAKNLITKRLLMEAPILYASFVDINDLEKSSPLGRIVSEQVSSRIAQHGFRVLEMKLRQHSIYIQKNEGEFLLSREIREISDSVDSDFVIVGTYAVAERNIYVSVRVVDTTDNSIETGYDYQLQRNYETDSLLNDLP